MKNDYFFGGFLSTKGKLLIFLNTSKNKKIWSTSHLLTFWISSVLRDSLLSYRSLKMKKKCYVKNRIFPFKYKNWVNCGLLLVNKNRKKNSIHLEKKIAWNYWKTRELLPFWPFSDMTKIGISRFFTMIFGLFSDLKHK